MQGPWRIGALVFTLVLGSFAGDSGALRRIRGLAAETSIRRTGWREASVRRGYGSGCCVFSTGWRAACSAGRIARPLADRAGVSRERLAWVVDSTGSPVACVAFISTWIATQLSLIEQGLRDAPFEVEPYAMFFQSVPANAYCLLTLLLVPLAIRTRLSTAGDAAFQGLAAGRESEAAPVDSPRALGGVGAAGGAGARAFSVVSRCWRASGSMCSRWRVGNGPSAGTRDRMRWFSAAWRAGSRRCFVFPRNAGTRRRRQRCMARVRCCPRWWCSFSRGRWAACSWRWAPPDTSPGCWPGGAGGVAAAGDFLVGAAMAFTTGCWAHPLRP
jgi:hypothetical protein